MLICGVTKKTVGDDKIFQSTSAKNLVVVIDTNLKLDKYIINTCKSAYFHMKNIGRIKSCLSDGDVTIFIRF